MIDRSNYEIWFMDWLDKNLSDSQAEELMLFLESNTDLKEEFNNLASLSSLESSKTSYPYHGKLRKAPSDITPLQFELLCAASIENDLREEHEADFKKMLSGNSERQKTFELISKARLIPPDIKYSGKNRLKRNKITRTVPLVLSLVGAAASVIAIVFFSSLFNKTAEVYLTDNLADTIYIYKSVPSIAVTSSQMQPSKKMQVKSIQTAAGIKEKIDASETSLPEKAAEPETLLSESQNDIIHEAVYNYDIPELSSETTQLASNQISIPELVFDDFEERSNLGKFIASTLRKKVLKEDEFNDSPLKGYEIAEAGITGINKLLGWEMALTRNTDEKGELKSVRFSSRMIKFNAPIKNDEVDE
ncbi:MAG TPA: hypothetical protein VHO50_04495 [Bacteroidales bacterium]|nr:hypothetical protein [Bacteroidales bacterium]